MFPPPDRVNYAEMRVQRIQIPVQVPVLKPVYVDYPYPNYVLVQGESKVSQLHRQYGNLNNLLSHPDVKKQIEVAMVDSEESSESSEDEIDYNITTKSRKQSKLQEQQQQILLLQQQQQQLQKQLTEQVKQSREIAKQTVQEELKPPIQLDYPSHDTFKPNYQQTMAQNQSQNQSRYLQNIDNTSAVSKVMSEGRRQLEEFKKRQSIIQQNGEAGISRTVQETIARSRKGIFE